MEKRTLYHEGTFKKGNLHTHSTRSDGINTPEEIAAHYRKKGYDFLAITDHWVYGTNENLNRQDFLVFPGTELDIELPGRKDHHLVGFGLPESNRIPDGYTFEEERKGNTEKYKSQNRRQICRRHRTKRRRKVNACQGYSGNI